MPYVKLDKQTAFTFSDTYIEWKGERLKIGGTAFAGQATDGGQFLAIKLTSTQRGKLTGRDDPWPDGEEICKAASDPDTELHKFLKIKWSDKLWGADLP